MAGVGKRRFKRALEESLGAKQEKLKLVPALLGAYFNGQKTVTVAGREDFVWCRVRGSTSEVVQAFNEEVGAHYDLPILIYRDPNAPDIYKVYGRDIRQYDDWGGLYYSSNPHGRSHSFGGVEGNDPVWIYKRQYLPMLPRPVATGSLDIWIEPEFWYFGGQYHWWPGSGTTDLSGFKPTGSMNGRYVTVYIDGNAGIPQYLLGDEFNLIYTPKDPGDYISLPNSAQGVPIAAVFLMTGTERIGWGEIYDLRQPEIPLPSTGSALQVYDNHVSEGQFGGIDFLELLNVEATGTTAYVNVAPPVSGSFVVFDEGVVLGSALGLNVVGGIGEIVLSGSYAHLMLTGSAIGLPATGSVTIYDEGILLGQADAINVLGDEVQAVLSGTTAHFMHTGVAGVGGGSGSVIIQDESILLGSADTLDFLGGGVNVTVAGDIASITIPSQALPAGSGSVYVRAGQAINLADVQAERVYWRIPEGSYVSGSLAVGVNGVWQIPVIDYTEQYPISGTFALDDTPPTGTVVGVIWGAMAPMAGFGIYDEGVLLGYANDINFTGDNVEVVLSGSFAHVMVSGGTLAVTTGTHYVEEILYEITLGSATGSVVAAGLDQGYDHLRIILNGRGDSGNENQTFSMYFNGDRTAANYRNGRHAAGIIHAVAVADTASVGLVPGGGALADQWGSVEASILQYSEATKRKNARIESALRTSAANIYLWENTLSWENDAAITSIELSTDADNNDDWIVGTLFQVIGIKETVVVTDVSLS